MTETNSTTGESLRTLAGGLCFGEGPRWHDGALWCSDMHAHEVLKISADGDRTVVARVPNRPSGLGWLPDGRLLIVSMTDRRLLVLEDDGLHVHSDLSELAAAPCNDMVVDAAGRAYVGHFGFDLFAAKPERRSAELLLVEPDGVARVAASDLEFPNGTVITPDGHTLIVAESMGRRLTAFDVSEDGSLSARRIWADLDDAVPDGVCLDADDGIWVASPSERQAFRVIEGGSVTERINLPDPAFACMLGGHDGRTLHILTAASSEPEVCRADRTGRILTVRVNAPRAGFP